MESQTKTTELEQTTTQEAAQTETQTEMQKEEKQNTTTRSEQDELQMGVQTLEIKKDIYNTFAILRATMVSTTQGPPQSIWQARFSLCDKAIFSFFLCLITVIQIGGFFVLYNDATDFAVENLVSQGTQVFLDSGVVDFTLLNVNVTYNYTMDISYADLNLLDTDPTKLNPNDVDLSVLFSQLVADVCMVLYLFKGLSQTGKLVTLSKHLPYYHKQKWLVIGLTITKLLVWLTGSMASLVIIALATTSIEAFEKAIAVFFLVETAEWVYLLIRAHPEIHDKLYQIKVDLTSVIEENEQDTDSVDEKSRYENELKQREYEIYERMMAENAFVNVFIQTVIFLFLYIGMQFAMLLKHEEFFVVVVVAFVLVIVNNRRTKRFADEAKRLAKQQASLQMTMNNNDYH